MIFYACVCVRLDNTSLICLVICTRYDLLHMALDTIIPTRIPTSDSLKFFKWKDETKNVIETWELHTKNAT